MTSRELDAAEETWHRAAADRLAADVNVARQPNGPAELTSGDCFVLRGGMALSGEISIGGAKNAALPMLAAALLTEDEVIIENIPAIEDVDVLSQVLRSLGASVSWVGPNRLRVCAAQIHSFCAPTQLVRRMRASFLVMGPLLGRFGMAASCAPGGDVIGQRPIDVHLTGFAALGARIRLEGEIYTACARRLQGGKIFMDYPSHIGTENVLMAAVLARGKTIIKNASQEPEVVDLARLLNQMGARISGAGHSTIEVEGVERLHGAVHQVIPDRIEAGTYAVAAAITAGDVTLRNVEPGHLDALIWKLTEAGAQVDEGRDSLRIRARRPLHSTHIQALPYPGFATDLQAAIGVLLTQAEGTSIIHERVYDGRLLYFKELRKMGVVVDIRGQTAVVTGPQRLTGAEVRALDIRSGAALVLAGLAAEGETHLSDIYHLERGYEGFDHKLRALGAQIERKASG